MDVGLFLTFDRSHDMTQADAFDQAFSEIDLAEDVGLHSVWLAEMHFAGDRSVLASPLVVASAIAARTNHLRMGTAVQVLPLTNPVRLAEEVATLDHISRGRFDFGIGRSGLARSYVGYNIPYAESQGRFYECLDILRKAWTEDTFSYEGEFYSYHNVAVAPKPYQLPYPPIRMAAGSNETYPLVGQMGLPIFLSLRTVSIEDLQQSVAEYKKAWHDAGQPGEPDLAMRIPVYVADTMDEALSEPEEGVMSFFRNLGQMVVQSGAQGRELNDERSQRANRLAEISYEEVLREKVAFGTPEVVVERLQQLQEDLSLSMVIAEVSTGLRLPPDRVLNSIRLLGEQVAPSLS